MNIHIISGLNSYQRRVMHLHNFESGSYALNAKLISNFNTLNQMVGRSSGAEHLKNGSQPMVSHMKEVHCMSMSRTD